MTPSLTIATWNVNGIRARLDRVLDWISRNPVDVLCVQESKAPNDQFPAAPFEQIGYRLALHGQKSFNGVALIARQDMDDVVRGLEGDPQTRLIGATVGDVRVFSAYFPNGQAVGSDKYAYKLQWMADLRDLRARELEKPPRLVLCGDFNVAPEPRDTHDPEVWEGNILCSDREREALAALRGLGLHDAFRAVRPDDVAFTWWDYRALAFPKNHGLRIDHVYVTEPLLSRIASVTIDRDARKGKQASDHTPVVTTLRASV
ncbi:MAG: exodeoxyribonuclease III [Deltaproteobacteria bacterium HGW-Deltaproteobacteria-20]|nr:MAG: exodeoxyribonuclease III [Deltaproteobacteria bacterium HGW-Deltaproteobacteria-20]